MRRIRTPPRLESRPADAHKASVGRVLVVGGSRDMCGAPALAALGALRSGAGLVRIAVPRPIQGVVATLRPEATTAGLPATKEGSFGAGAAAAATEMALAWDAVVLGPGGGRETTTLRQMAKIAVEVERPLVLDADALFAFGDDSVRLGKRKHATILTPHEGEAGRLLGTTAREVREDREAAALALAAASGAVVVLKGKGTLVTDGARIYRCPKGGPWLATGGSGDVLAGVVGALLAGLPATGGDAFGAAVAAVFVHAAAADRLAKGLDRGLIASDLAAALPGELALLVGPAEGRRG